MYTTPEKLYPLKNQIYPDKENYRLKSSVLCWILPYKDEEEVMEQLIFESTQNWWFSYQPGRFFGVGYPQFLWDVFNPPTHHGMQITQKKVGWSYSS